MEGLYPLTCTPLFVRLANQQFDSSSKRSRKPAGSTSLVVLNIHWTSSLLVAWISWQNFVPIIAGMTAVSGPIPAKLPQHLPHPRGKYRGYHGITVILIPCQTLAGALNVVRNKH